MNQGILEEILENCNWHEKVKVKILNKLAIKIYKFGVKKGFNLAN